jgi:hypothetical protein
MSLEFGLPVAGRAGSTLPSNWNNAFVWYGIRQAEVAVLVKLYAPIILAKKVRDVLDQV